MQIPLLLLAVVMLSALTIAKLLGVPLRLRLISILGLGLILVSLDSIHSYKSSIRDSAQVFTPKYKISVVSNGYRPNLDLIDAKYEAVNRCLNIPQALSVEKARELTIFVRTDQLWFDCPHREVAQGILLWPSKEDCYGQYYPHSKTIHVTEDLFSLGHETVHYIHSLQHDDLVSLCGNSIDDYFSALGYGTDRAMRNAEYARHLRGAETNSNYADGQACE